MKSSLLENVAWELEKGCIMEDLWVIPLTKTCNYYMTLTCIYTAENSGLFWLKLPTVSRFQRR